MTSKPFPLQVTFGHDLSHSHRKQRRTVATLKFSRAKFTLLLFVSRSVSKPGKVDELIQLREAEWSRDYLGLRREGASMGEGRDVVWWVVDGGEGGGDWRGGWVLMRVGACQSCSIYLLHMVPIIIRIPLHT